MAGFFVGAYLWSWLWWIPALFTGIEGATVVPTFIGVFGPALSAAAVTRLTGGSVREWLRSIFRFRVARRWYALALAIPLALMALTTLELIAVGVDLEFSLVGERLGAFLPLLIFCLLLNGGPEEPGWRGFALPRLQERMTPVRATIVLGVVWALWHIPIFLAEDGSDHGLGSLALAAIVLWTIGGIVAYSFAYTYLWNRTRSVVPAMLLHAAFNTTNGALLLVPDADQTGGTYATISICLTGTLIIGVLAMVRLTRGRLGMPESQTPR